jgi:hypothetical protein
LRDREKWEGRIESLELAVGIEVRMGRSDREVREGRDSERLETGSRDGGRVRCRTVI